MNTVEVYDGSEWNKSVSLPYPIMLAAAVSHKGSLYVSGGLTGSRENPQSVSTILKLKVYPNLQWDVFLRIKDGRLNHHMSSWGDYILITGGYGIHNKRFITQLSRMINFNTDSRPI